MCDDHHVVSRHKCRIIADLVLLPNPMRCGHARAVQHDAIADRHAEC